MLENVGTQYVRIDGAIPTIERNRIIKQFQEDPETSLLLMTTGTGAVGYNISPIKLLLVQLTEFSGSI